MKPGRILLLSVLALSITPVYPLSFEDTYGISAGENFGALADQVVETRFDESSMTLQQKLIRLKNLQLRIDAKLQQFKDDPIIWFLSGLNQNNLAEIHYLLVVEQSGRQQAASDSSVSNFNIARSRAYDNAIRLDSAQPYRLSSSIYATMSYGLSNRQKIKTYSRELALGSPAENESNEYFMHWAKVDALVQERKLDEAQQALEDLRQLLQQRNKTDASYSSIVERAEAQVSAQIKISEKRQAASASAPQSKVVRQTTEGGQWGWRNWLLTGFGAITFTFVLIAALYLRKK